MAERNARVMVFLIGVTLVAAAFRRRFESVALESLRTERQAGTPDLIPGLAAGRVRHGEAQQFHCGESIDLGWCPPAPS